MRVSEAKDFLAQQTEKQAQMEGVPLSGLEKRMMYFTESPDDTTEDICKLNDEFEAEYDTPTYEAKISGLLRRAHARVKKENSESLRLWDESVTLLQKGDHYILILLDKDSALARPPHDSLKLLGAGILTAAIFVALMMGFSALSPHYGGPLGRGRAGSGTEMSAPMWLQRLIIALMVGGYVSYVILPWVLRKLPVGISESLPRFLRNAPKHKAER
jgi:hypothetical protein